MEMMHDFFGPIIQAPNLSHVPHGFTTRNGGQSLDPAWSSFNLLGTDPAAESNRKILLRQYPGFELRTLSQVHGKDFVWSGKKETVKKTADAHATVDERLLVAVGVADCAPILLATRDGRAVMAIHAGWRGAIKNIVLHSVLDASQSLNIPTHQWIAAVGPCLHACCMEIQQDVAEQWRGIPFAVELRRGRIYLNFLKAILQDFTKLGIRNVWVSDHCTSCHPHLYFSYRRDKGQTGRHLGFIGVREDPRAATDT
jgi:YfiH family protein